MISFHPKLSTVIASADVKIRLAFPARKIVNDFFAIL